MKILEDEVRKHIYVDGQYGVFTSNKLFLYKDESPHEEPFTSLTQVEAVQLLEELRKYFGQQ